MGWHSFDRKNMFRARGALLSHQHEMHPCKLLALLFTDTSVYQDLLILVKRSTASLSTPEYMTKGSVALPSEEYLYLRLCVFSLGEQGNTGWCTKI